MQGDRQSVVVEPPELLEGVFRLKARIDEDEHHAVPADQVVDRRHGVPGGVAGERQRAADIQHVQVGLGAALHHDEVGHGRCRNSSALGGGGRVLRDQILPQLVRLAHRGREADGAGLRCQPPHPGEREGEKIAALRGDEGVQFVEDDGAQPGKEAFRLAVGEQQRELLGGREQDVGWALNLSGALVRRGVAGPGLDRDGEIHAGDRRVEVAGDVDGERLERRDVEGVKAPRLAPPAIGALAQLDQARQEAGQRLARAGRCDEQRRAPGPDGREQFELMRAGRPAAGGEPRGEARRKGRGGHGVPAGHVGRVPRSFIAAAYGPISAADGSGRSVAPARPSPIDPSRTYPDPTITACS